MKVDTNARIFPRGSRGVTRGAQELQAEGRELFTRFLHTRIGEIEDEAERGEWKTELRALKEQPGT